MAAEVGQSRWGSHGICIQGQSTAEPGLYTALRLGAEGGHVISGTRTQDAVSTMTRAGTTITRHLAMFHAQVSHLDNLKQSITLVSDGWAPVLPPGQR